MVILGPNGCGKSTLLKVLAGLLQPRCGTVRIDGKALSDISGKELARVLAYLPQSRPVPEITVERLVLHGRFPYLGYPRRYREQDRESARKAMAAVGVDVLASRELSTLSGGERQKAYIAMALAQDTPYILLDEPTIYLDIDRQLEVMRLCCGMRDAGKTVLVVLHDLSLALRFADRILLMQQGASVFEGTPAELAASDALDRVFHVHAQPVTAPDGSVQYLFYE